MTLSKKFAAMAVALAIGGFAGPAAAKTEIQWWHAMENVIF